MPYLTEKIVGKEPIDCRILSAGLDLFVERGYHNVSVHDIQKQANVSIGSIYNHFGGKEGVAEGLYNHLALEIEKLVDDVIATESDTLSRCKTIIKRLFEHTETDREIIAYVFNAKHREFLPNLAPMCSAKPFEKIRDLVNEGIAEGVFKPTNSWVAASAVFGSAIRMIQLRLDGLLEHPLPEYYEEVVETALQGILAKPTS